MEITFGNAEAEAEAALADLNVTDEPEEEEEVCYVPVACGGWYEPACTCGGWR